MLVWINGAFGAGKTTVADALLDSWPEAIRYDPEEVGFMLQKLVPSSGTGDFQDLSIWRRLVADVAVAMLEEYQRPLVVPMTIVNPDYQREVFTGIRARGGVIHAFALQVGAAETRRRITEQVMDERDAVRDQQIRNWRLSHVDRCVAALDTGELGEPISNEGRPAIDVAAEIRSKVAAGASPHS